MRILLSWLFLLLIIVTSAQAQSQSYSFFTPDIPSGAGGGSDQNSVEVGVRFNTDVDGSISAIRWWKPTASDTTHSATLWQCSSPSCSSGTVLAQATSGSETASGWQQVTFGSPVLTFANSYYVASYHTHGYRTQQSYAWPASQGVLHSPSNAGVYNYSSGVTFPSATYNSSNYWVDVVFTPSNPTPTPTPGSTATPRPTVNPTGYVCTEIVGFSETEQWYTGGFIQNVPNPGDWQLRWYSGGSIDQWAAGSSFAGWQSSALVTHCVNSSSAPDRVILNVSGNYNTDPTWWANQTQLTVNYVTQTYSPTTRTISLQPVVGGPSGSLCPTSDPLATFPWVRASYNYPFIESGLQTLFISGTSLTINQGAFAQVRACGDYSDWAGHFNDPAVQAAIGSYIGNFYSLIR